MVIISKTVLSAFAEKYPHSTNSLNKWYEISKNANWNNLGDIRSDISDVEYVGNDRYVFNIGGNKFRLIVMMHFSIRTIYVRFIGTHIDYDKIKANQV